MHGADYNAKIALDAVRGVKTINQIAQEFGMHPVQVVQWTKKIQVLPSELFEGSSKLVCAAP